VRQLLRGVYVAADVPDTYELRIRAGRLVVAEGHVLCDRTAAWVHGVNLLGYAEREILPPIETCVLPDGWATRAAGLSGHSRDLALRDVVCVDGLLVTTPLRTALDVACNVELRDALAALDQFNRIHGIDTDDLVNELPRFRGRRGVVQARALAPLIDGRAESVRESWVRAAIVNAGLPVPELQIWVDRDGLPTYRLDMGYRAHRIAIEYDGEEFHSTAEDRARDEDRRRWLRSQGWIVIVVTNGDFSAFRLENWLSQVRRALDERYCNLRW
jgi:hypothetical protein